MVLFLALNNYINSSYISYSYTIHLIEITSAASRIKLATILEDTEISTGHDCHISRSFKLGPNASGTITLK